MKNMYNKIGLLLVCLAGFINASAQISSGGTPFSFSTFSKTNDAQLTPLVTTTLPKFPLEKVLKEDQVSTGIRFAAPVAVDLGFNNAGSWTTLKNGDRLWRLKIHSAGALGLSALYDDLYLPPGATLFMYSEDGQQLLGAYTHESNTPNFTFMTGFIYAEAAVIEYYEPKAVRGQGHLHIFRIDHAYKKEVFEEKNGLNDFGFGASDACNVNINCQVGANWQKQKRGICRIIIVVEEGTGYCTGNLVNNAKNDGTPYILTAFHCQDGYTPKYDFWRFDFNYESSTCNNPSIEPAYQSMLGSTLRASRRQNDFLLLEMDTIPNNYNVYYNGWDRKSAAPASSLSIHHPKGDIKKIAVENQVAQIYTSPYQWLRSDGTLLYTSPANHLFRVQFDASTVEVGSSGAALFDNNGRIVGQLHGGNELGSCTVNIAYYDRFSLSWEGGGAKENRLKDWLDPESTNVSSLDGIEKISETSASISGYVRTRKGEGIAGVIIQLDGPVKANTVTDTSGAYRFQNLTPSEFYTISLEKDGGDKNGVNVLDISLTSKHILGIQPFDDPLKRLAADVNNSKAITVLDNVTLRKLILGVDAEFTMLPSWRFVPESFEFTDPENPWNDFISAKFAAPKLETIVQNFNFIGYKTGDVDFSANPKN